MNIILTRYHTTQQSIDGFIKIDDVKVCDCAEHAPTALPPGTYPIKIFTCKHYHRKMPIICHGEKTMKCVSCHMSTCPNNNTVLSRYCPMLKIGNGVHNRSDGSVIIGDRITWGAIAHPVEHFNRLIDRLDKAQNRGESITLTIQ